MRGKAIILMVVFSIVGYAGHLYAGSRDTLSLSGVVGIAGQDKNNRTTAIALLVRQEPAQAPSSRRHSTIAVEPAPRRYQLYAIANTETGRELFDLIGETIVAVGTIDTDKRGNKTFTIIRYANKSIFLAPPPDIDTLTVFNE